MLSRSSVVLAASSSSASLLPAAERVRIGVVADFVPVVENAADDRLVAGDVLADDEEGALGAVLLQHVQHLRRLLGVRAVVERQRDDLAAVRVLGKDHALFLIIVQLRCGRLRHAQLVHASEAVALVLERDDDVLEDGRVGGRGRVQQHHHPVVDVGKDFFLRRLRVGLLIVVPVGVGEGPEHRRQPQPRAVLERLLGERALRRAEQFAHRVSGVFGVQRFQVGDFLFKRFKRHIRHILVRIGMVAHQMPLLVHPLDERGVGFDEIGQNKEGPRHLLPLEDVQRLFDVAVLVAGVEGQVNHLLLAASEINAAVFIDERLAAVHLGLPVLGVGLEIPARRRRGRRVRHESERQKQRQEQGFC